MPSPNIALHCTVHDAYVMIAICVKYAKHIRAIYQFSYTFHALVNDVVA